MDIEKIATAALNGYFSKKDGISPFVSEGDKEPLSEWVFSNCKTIDRNIRLINK